MAPDFKWTLNAGHKSLHFFPVRVTQKLTRFLSTHLKYRIPPSLLAVWGGGEDSSNLIVKQISSSKGHGVSAVLLQQHPVSLPCTFHQRLIRYPNLNLSYPPRHLFTPLIIFSFLHLLPLPLPISLFINLYVSSRHCHLQKELFN